MSASLITSLTSQIATYNEVKTFLEKQTANPRITKQIENCDRMIAKWTARIAQEQAQIDALAAERAKFTAGERTALDNLKLRPELSKAELAFAVAVNSDATLSAEAKKTLLNMI